MGSNPGYILKSFLLYLSYGCLLLGIETALICIYRNSNHSFVLFFQVECFAPYDDHRWVNIGKEKNGMAPDAVQYARALRPPYQLLSFLRIKGNCAKGMGCSNKNTMVSFEISRVFFFR